MKKAALYILFIPMCVFCASQAIGDTQTSLSSNQKIVMRNSYEKAGERLFEQGRYAEALLQFEKACDPAFLLYPDSLPGSLHNIQRVYTVLGDYDKALEISHTLLSGKGNHEPILEKKSMYEALIHAKETDSIKPVLEWIIAIREKYADILPPKGHSMLTSTVIANILYLYDAIGDYDAGIAFINEILNWSFDSDPQIAGVKNIKTVEEIGDKYLWKGPSRTDKYRREYKWLREYLLVREAFELDKKEGKKGAMKEGKPGRAPAQALIQSDYFPLVKPAQQQQGGYRSDGPTPTIYKRA